ncbi:MAG: aldo/keto reductase [Paenibacillus sp.]|jgi:aryl-alcohol dehydrogenase-like predicted oxidoreductase|nr:aldo/keto reductase [Paenibacillus sp.]
MEPAVAEKARKVQNAVHQLKGIADELGKTPAQVSLNWIIHRPAVSSAIMDVSRLEQLEENVGAVGGSSPRSMYVSWTKLSPSNTVLNIIRRCIVVLHSYVSF